MSNHRKKVQETIEKLGTEIVECHEKLCLTSFSRDQDAGYIPRVFFLHPNDDSPLDLAIIGGNPGNAGKPELGENKKIWSEKKDPRDAYRKLVQRIWREFPIAPENSPHYRPYYAKPLQFLKALNMDRPLVAMNGILYLEVVYCETGLTPRCISDATDCCINKYLKRKEMLDLLSRCEHVLCLGLTNSYRYVKELPQANQWKVIGLYHPTPEIVCQPYWFNNYFKDPKTRTKLKPTIIEELENSENMNSYQAEVKIKRDGTPFLLQDCG